MGKQLKATVCSLGVVCTSTETACAKEVCQKLRAAPLKCQQPAKQTRQKEYC